MEITDPQYRLVEQLSADAARGKVTPALLRALDRLLLAIPRVGRRMAH